LKSCARQGLPQIHISLGEKIPILRAHLMLGFDRARCILRGPLPVGDSGPNMLCHLTVTALRGQRLCQDIVEVGKQAEGPDVGRFRPFQHLQDFKLLISASSSSRSPGRARGSAAAANPLPRMGYATCLVCRLPSPSTAPA
jgi:hypothetical protein